MRFTFRSTGQEKDVAQFRFCWNCGSQLVRLLPTPRYPEQLPVVVDADKMQGRRRKVFLAMEGRPGEVRKSRVADEVSAFVFGDSAGSRGSPTPTLDDVFSFLSFLDTQGKSTKIVRKTSCPGVSHTGDDGCLEGSSCAKRYAAKSIRFFFSKLKMTMKGNEKGEQWDPVRRVSTPYSSPLVDLYLTFVSEKQKQIGV